MSDLIAIAYPDLETAKTVSGRIAEAQKSHDIELDDLVVVERQEGGKIKLHQPSLAATGAGGGALWGGLIGLIFFVPLFGMAVGAASGAAGGALSDYGIDDNFLKTLGAELDEGKAAVILLARKLPADRVLDRIEIPGTIIQTSLEDEAEARLGEALAAAGAK